MREKISVAGSWHAPYLRRTLHRIAHQEPWENDLTAYPHAEHTSEYWRREDGRDLGEMSAAYGAIFFSFFSFYCYIIKNLRERERDGDRGEGKD